MQLCIAGISFKTAAVEIREKLSFEEKNLDEAYRLLLAKDEVNECVILSTCNRVEIYAMLHEDRVAVLRDFFRDYHKYSDNLDNIFYWKKGIDALRHMCIVAAGLDSMVLGESQIFGQMKDAFARAVKLGGVQYTFEHLFSQIFSTVKKIRNKTGIGEKNVSVSYAAVKLARSIFSDINGRKVMILGAGEMGRLTVRNLIDAGISGVVVANRTFQKAVEIAEKFAGIPVMFHEIIEYLQKVDILISSISSSGYIITADMIKDIYSHGKKEPLFVVDISVPRSIDPDLKKLANVHLYNIDDLNTVVESNSIERQKEAQKALLMIDKKIATLSSYLEMADLIPTLVSIRSKAEEIRKSSIEHIVRDLTISTKQRNIIEEMTKAIVNKILFHSEMKIREFSSASKTLKN